MDSDTVGRSHRNPLVGRTSELEMLRQLLFVSQRDSEVRLVKSQSAAAIPLDTLRRPQCMVLMGEAGIGKTRLAEELSREVQERGWIVAWSRSYAQESTIPYRLWIDILRGLINSDPWQKEVLSEQPLIYARLAVLLPELYERLPGVTAPASQLAGQEQQSLWEAVLELFKMAIERIPLLVVLDDLQWADASSCELLAYLARRLSGYPIVFLGTCREVELAPKHPLRPLIAHMQREHTISTLQIQPLSDAAINLLIANTQLPEKAVQDVRRQAAGNPFFAEELAYSYSVLSSAKAEHTPARTKNSSLPLSIAAALDQRMSKLSRDCQQLLGNAAVLGGSFEFSLIRSMESSGSTPIDEDTVLDLLDEALQAGVLTEEGRGTRINYHFWQPLLVSHLYEGLSATRRAQLHKRAADIVRKFYAKREEEGAATITHHLVQGGAEAQEIVYYATLAGDRAYSLSAYPEAERYYRIASEHVRMVNMQAASLEDRARLAYLLEQLGECIRIQGNYQEARQVYERLLQERGARQEHDTPAEAQREAQIDALLWSEVGWTWYYAGDYAHTRQYCERGEEVLREAGVIGGPAWARLYFQHSYILWQEGKYDEARQAADEALRLFEEMLPRRQSQAGFDAPLTRMRHTLVGDPVDLARTHRLLGALANSVGQLTEALTHFNTALAILEEHDHKREVAHVSCNVGYVHLQKAEHEQARPFFRRSLSLAEQIGDVPLTAVIYSNLGVLAGRTGDLQEAENWLKRSLILAEQTNDQVYLSTWHAELAAVYQDQGRLAEAGMCIGRALMIGRAMGNAPCIGYALVALGNLRIVQAQEAGENERRPYGHGRHGRRRYLARANNTLQRALTFDRLEAGARNRGQLALAQVNFLRGDTESAWVQALHALKKARQYELTWLAARSLPLLGDILAAQGQKLDAYQHFEQALQIFRACAMRLETARTLQSYALVLLQEDEDIEMSHQRALGYLQEALQMCSECHAAIDQRRIEGIIFSRDA
jgi:tetratricopeptide (TPR) repeat protein